MESQIATQTVMRGGTNELQMSVWPTILIDYSTSKMPVKEGIMRI